RVVGTALGRLGGAAAAAASSSPQQPAAASNSQQPPAAAAGGGEEAAANLVRVNDHVLLASGFPRSAEMLDRLGYRVKLIDIGEAAKIDGGLSCMSLRYTRQEAP
ncbi:MAG: hypothetical protein VXY90_13625, partial [Pseudomonadota bacterium]|nr:hypothetical protein [Pseudomonadota bacterium]